MGNSPYKVIARHWGFIGGGGSMYRVIDVRDGSYIDTSVALVHRNIGEQLFAGHCFVPTAVDYPVIHLVDGDQYKLPVVDPRTGECVENDKVIVLFELVRGSQVVGYRVTDYAGGLTDLSLEEVLNYKDVGFWNAVLDGKFLKPLGKYVFPRIMV